MQGTTRKKKGKAHAWPAGSPSKEQRIRPLVLAVANTIPNDGFSNIIQLDAVAETECETSVQLIFVWRLGRAAGG